MHTTAVCWYLVQTAVVSFLYIYSIYTIYTCVHTKYKLFCVFSPPAYNGLLDDIYICVYIYECKCVTHKSQELVGRETDNYRWVPLYALVMMLWAAMFQKYWKRTSSEWWATYCCYCEGARFFFFVLFCCCCFAVADCISEGVFVFVFVLCDVPR